MGGWMERRTSEPLRHLKSRGKLAAILLTPVGTPTNVSLAGPHSHNLQHTN